jgi:hypothetical protein
MIKKNMLMLSKLHSLRLVSVQKMCSTQGGGGKAKLQLRQKKTLSTGGVRTLEILLFPLGSTSCISIHIPWKSQFFTYQACQIEISEIRRFLSKNRSLPGEFLL